MIGETEPRCRVESMVHHLKFPYVPSYLYLPLTSLNLFENPYVCRQHGNGEASVSEAVDLAELYFHVSIVVVFTSSSHTDLPHTRYARATLWLLIRSIWSISGSSALSTRLACAAFHYHHHAREEEECKRAISTHGQNDFEYTTTGFWLFFSFTKSIKLWLSEFAVLAQRGPHVRKVEPLKRGALWENSVSKILDGALKTMLHKMDGNCMVRQCEIVFLTAIM